MSDFTSALAWFTAAPKEWIKSGQKSLNALGLWIWETVQGDFSENQSVGQIATGTVISMIPVVDQICDVRDLVANCRNIHKDSNNIGAWVALCLTLIGLFPTLGSFAKGGLKVAFLYLRKAVHGGAGKAIGKIDPGTMIKIIYMLQRFLDQPVVRKTLAALKIYNPYKYLAEQLRQLMGKINVNALLKQFDKLLDATKKLLNKAADWGPQSIKQPIKDLLALLSDVRKQANTMLGKALDPLTQILGQLARRLEKEGTNAHTAYADSIAKHSHKAHLMGEADLMHKHKPDWVDLGKVPQYKQLDKLTKEHKDAIIAGWPGFDKPPLKDKFKTFDNSMNAVEILPGEKLYRVLAPNSNDNSICWMREAEFKALKSKADWRRCFAVWKDWNANGEYVVYTVPPGQTLKVWEGRAATQIHEADKTISLEGGAVQIVLNPADLQRHSVGKRQATGWGYTDPEVARDIDKFLGLPKLSTNWYGDKK
ncbi:MAG: hypothetical protein H6R07_3410 [Proteobacteria bacterium]|nr:hypothetical protein [Pseudomonadota bacterium]